MGNEHNTNDADMIGRRDAIKKTAVGAAAAGVVWSAPRIEGLSLRPIYAAAASGAGGPFNFDIGISSTGGAALSYSIASPPGLDNIRVTRTASGQTSIFFSHGGASFGGGAAGSVTAADTPTPGWFASPSGPNDIVFVDADAGSGNVAVTYNCV